MARSTHHDERPFLSIVAWPDGWTRGRVVQLLVEIAGVDPHDAAYRLRQRPPMIVGQMEPFAAHRFTAAFMQHGGDAFTCTLDEMAALGPTLKIRDLKINEAGNLEAELWNGLSTTIRRHDVQILIRAHLSRETLVRTPPPVARTVMGSRIPVASTMSGVGGALGLALAFEAGYLATAGVDVERDLNTSDKLDIHTADRSVYQVDGDKFGFRILGDLRGHGDRANMDALCELLAHLAPDEIVDPYFPLWRKPTGFHRLRLPNNRPNDDDPAFAFYSRWTALMYRHVLGER